MVRDSQWRYIANGLIPEGKSLPEGVLRYGAVVEYNGRLFCGWQRQSHSPSVQAEVEAALSHVANQPVTVACAGRTDTGVHATHQVIHFDTSAVRQPHNWLMGANTKLPEGINLHWVNEVPAQFHARFSALSRTYRYIIANQAVKSALFAGMLSWIKAPLDEQKMHEAAQYLLGEQDFSSFRAAGCQSKSPFRNVTKVRVFRRGELVALEITANAFLHHMVRNIAGVLIAVGKGEKPLSWVPELLAMKDRKQAEVTAAPHGLYLVGVGYPETFALPSFSPGPLFLPESVL